MDDYDIRSAASILASVKEQEARFERLTRALEEERRNVSLQLERANQPSERMSMCNIGNGQPLATAWQQLVLQGSHFTTSPTVKTAEKEQRIEGLFSCPQDLLIKLQEAIMKEEKYSQPIG
ncbi:hypothetical protein KIL84_009141 [Mauremys mutica]|uniref:Uncharacterized protein n=1 Tax=Mauremys mutica TaxID=74926 RepID=A0A9D3XJP9_9SAUR|nr:hypothetical protein KIL84_009141 [Mauremys mutica]